MTSFWSYLFGTIAKPQETFTALLEDPKRHSHVLWLLVLLLGPWAIAVATWVYLKAVPWVPTFVKVPDESYYFWELILGLPLFLLPMIMVAGTIHLLSRIYTQERTFEDLLPPFLFALNVPFFLFCIHDLAYALLCLAGVWTPEQFRSLITQPGIMMYINVIVGVGAFVWTIPLMAMVVRACYALSSGRSLFVSILSVPIFHAWVWAFFR
jgi:hypothetical protein